MSEYTQTSLGFISQPNPVEPSHVACDEPLTLFDNAAPFSIQYVKHGRDLVGQRQPHDTLLSRQVFDNDFLFMPAELPSNVLQTKPSMPFLSSSLFHMPDLAQSRPKQKQLFPPVLQGLHHPPPNAGLLPSINTTQTPDMVRALLLESVTISPRRVSSARVNAHKAAPTVALNKPPPRLRRWTPAETTMLLAGVARFGVGSWKRILQCPDYTFTNRSAVDIKDRYRVCKLKADREAADPDKTCKTSKTVDLPATSSRRRKRTPWTAEEDAALLLAFAEKAPSWVAISRNPALKSRTSTDVRDRMRIRYPQEYKRLGLVPKKPG